MADTDTQQLSLSTTSGKAQVGILDAGDFKCDLILEATGQHGKIDLYVSFRVLSPASTVFDTMLSSDFKEGVLQNDGSDRKRTPLLEDDRDALLYVCLVVHHRNQ